MTVSVASAIWPFWSGQEYTQAEKEAFATEKNDTYRELLKNMSPTR